MTGRSCKVASKLRPELCYAQWKQLATSVPMGAAVSLHSAALSSLTNTLVLPLGELMSVACWGSRRPRCCPCVGTRNRPISGWVRRRRSGSGGRVHRRCTRAGGSRWSLGTDRDMGSSNALMREAARRVTQWRPAQDRCPQGRTAVQRLKKTQDVG